MKKFVVCAVLAACLMVGSANAATIFLAADDGSGKLTLPNGGTGNINIMLTTSNIDPAGVAFINAFFDVQPAGENCEDVVGVTHGQIDPQWTYDPSAYKLPAEIGDECDGTGDEINEYGLVFGSSAGPGFPAGTNATYVIETLTILGNSDSGTSSVYFESGARKPQAFGPPPTYSPFTTNDFLCPGTGIPGFLNMGVGHYGNTGTGACKDGFEINKVPEPAALSLLALGGLAALRRRR